MTRCLPSERLNSHVKWLKRALLDLDEAEEYMAHADPSAADEVVMKILAAVSLLKNQPGLGRAGRVPGTKELVVPGTRYIVPYRVQRRHSPNLAGVPNIQHMATTVLTHVC